MIGDIFKNRGEYVEAIKWLRIDYDLSMKYLPEKQLLPTCQSLGEVFLRLEDFKEALFYQVIWFSGLFGWWRRVGKGGMIGRFVSGVSFGIQGSIVYPFIDL